MSPISMIETKIEELKTELCKINYKKDVVNGLLDCREEPETGPRADYCSSDKKYNIKLIEKWLTDLKVKNNQNKVSFEEDTKLQKVIELIFLDK